MTATVRPVLSLADVTLLHGDGEETVTALDHVDLDVAAGELVAVVGPSGSGKSSLLAVAGALTTPTSGRVRIGGEDLTTAGRRQLTALRRQRIGYVFQSGNLVPALTAVDQVRLPLTFGKVAEPRDPLALLAEVGMDHKADRRPHQLSGGERQRVGIARALVTRPELLLVDEPTAALDRQRSQDVVALLARETREHGVATVMVTHDHDVLHHCDRVLEMIDGRLAAMAT
ncbi:ABC transporter ATP-binding protein [Nocardioides sp. GY 10113]|uniref:ABC transporter ATP-binding protein n=1 Tax=Nocardioides sp. GY 10113 TaxID=2569761 RepID=UPI0010A81F20|nr:ABC transporter ATP-binding protein [Nocardioides sp. GY 10113]TIC87419.1 ABC transporter ATP-binding protein [Nocardioides sp. GY 10113]